MATPVAERAVLDTNILLAATDEARDDHVDALRCLNEWPRAGVVLYTSGQIVREYLAVATRPATQNGLELAQHDALTNVRALRARLSLLADEAKVSDRLLALLDAVRCGGKQVHDANLVATMLVHGVETIVTINVSDFTRFSDLVQVVDPRE